MANTAQQAYDAIKNLEASGELPLPEPSVTKLVGSFNAADEASSTFQYLWFHTPRLKLSKSMANQR
jgi:hypothetical protein